MTKQFDDTLRACIEELEESREDVEAVVGKHPEWGAELRRHLDVWVSLSGVGRAEASGPASARGLGRLLSAVQEVDQEQGGNKLMNTGGFALKLVGAAAVVAGIALGIAYVSGNMEVEFGSGAQASHTHPCLDSVLGGLDGDADHHFTGADLIAFRDAFQNQNTAPQFDRDGDGDVDIDDVMVYVQELKDCFGAPTP